VVIMENESFEISHCVALVRGFGGTYCLCHKGDSVLRLPVSANVVSSWPILVALMMEYPT
jgi:hypothetical protein